MPTCHSGFLADFQEINPSKTDLSDVKSTFDDAIKTVNHIKRSGLN